MNLDLTRLCELAGLGSTTRGVVSEAVAPAKPPVAPAKQPVAVAAVKQPAAGVKPPVAGVKPPVAEYDMYNKEEYMPGGDDEEGSLDEEALYEIDEEELAEALVYMRQTNLDESYVRDAVREEIARALRIRGASWLYGKNQPTNSKVGQVVQGGFGIGFKNK